MPIKNVYWITSFNAMSIHFIHNDTVMIYSTFSILIPLTTSPPLPNHTYQQTTSSHEIISTLFIIVLCDIQDSLITNRVVGLFLAFSQQYQHFTSICILLWLQDTGFTSNCVQIYLYGCKILIIQVLVYKYTCTVVRQ